MKRLLFIILFIHSFYSFSQEMVSMYYIGDSIVPKENARLYSLEHLDTAAQNVYKEKYRLSDNTLYSKAYYTADGSQMNGLCLYYYDNGSLSDSGYMQMGKRTGLHYFYHHNGQLASIVDFTGTNKEKYIECRNLQGKIMACDTVASSQPVFPGGAQALMVFLKNNIQYPAPARKKDIEGKVIVLFRVDYNGIIKDVSVKKSIDPSLDVEAIRVIKKLPNWTPGVQYNRSVDVYYSLPINFKLN